LIFIKKGNNPGKRWKYVGGISSMKRDYPRFWGTWFGWDMNHYESLASLSKSSSEFWEFVGWFILLNEAQKARWLV
jgi:hypothetical protein